jgi:magnesium transporter
LPARAHTHHAVLCGMLAGGEPSWQVIMMNEVMKLLTIIATIFIPITFLVGVYGMNFVYMPELKWRYGYFMVWAIMALVVAGLMLYFKRKKWI